MESLYRLQMQLAAVVRSCTWHLPIEWHPHMSRPRSIWDLSKIAVENGNDTKEYEAWRCDVCFRILVCITGDERAEQLRERITLAVELGIRPLGTMTTDGHPLADD